MAEILEFRPRAGATGRKEIDPVASVIVMRANKSRNAISDKANLMAGGSRASINAIDRELAEVREGILDARKSLRDSCGGNIHVSPLPAWLTWAIFLVGLAAEFAIADGLLDFAFLQGRPPGSLPFLGHFDGVGFLEGLVYVVTDYSTQKEWAAVGIAAYTFACAKATGTWIRQHAAARPSVPLWAVVAWNLTYAAACVGYVFLRHASLASDESSADMAYLAPVFFAIQLFFYVGAAFVSAWLADPDPEANRLAKLEKALSARFGKLLRKRAEVSAPVTAALVNARLKCDEIAAGALWDIATYRYGNLAGRPRDDVPPDFMVSTVGPEVFEPVWLDPPPDPPAELLEDVLKHPVAA